MYGTQVAQDPGGLSALSQTSKAMHDLVYKPEVGFGQAWALNTLTQHADPRVPESEFKPDSALTVPEGGFSFPPEAREIFGQRADNNVFTGVMGLKTRAGMLAPLQASSTYGNTDWTGDATLQGEDIGPLNHFHDPRFQYTPTFPDGNPNMSSHESLSHVVGAGHSLAPGAQNPVPTEQEVNTLAEDFIGFSVWSEGDRSQVGAFAPLHDDDHEDDLEDRDRVLMHWGSRGLNSNKFTDSLQDLPTGMMDEEHARAIAAAFGRDVYGGSKLEEERRRERS